jgi:hypothetical protein
MNFTFFHRPESRKYNYIPQFYVKDEDKVPKRSSYDSEEFAERLHRTWSKKRQVQKKNSGNIKSIVWIAFILFLLIFILYKLF